MNPKTTPPTMPTFDFTPALDAAWGKLWPYVAITFSLFVIVSVLRAKAERWMEKIEQERQIRNEIEIRAKIAAEQQP